MSLNQYQWASSTRKLTCSSIVYLLTNRNSLRKFRRRWERCEQRACTKSDHSSTSSRQNLTLQVTMASLMSSSEELLKPTIAVGMPALTHKTMKVLLSRISSKKLSRLVLNRGGPRWTTPSLPHPQHHKLTPEKRARPRRLKWRKRRRDQLRPKSKLLHNDLSIFP